MTPNLQKGYKMMTIKELEKVLHEMVRDGFGDYAFDIDTNGNDGTYFTINGKTEIDEKNKMIDFEAE